MKKLRCKVNGSSSAALEKLAIKSGFLVFEGAKHCKIKTASGELVTIIPRHSLINPHTAKAIVKDLNDFGANIEIC